MEEKKRLDIMIAIPSMGDVSMMFTCSIVGMILKTKEKYPDCTITISTAIRRLIHKARTELVDNFLETDCNYLMFIDDDNPPKPDDLNNLIELDLPIVSGLYFRRNPPYEPIIMAERKNGIGTERRPDLYRNKDGKPFKVHSTGMGFMLIKREVFAKMKELGIPLFEIRGSVGEDIWFCLQARQAGYDILIAPDVEIAHLGERMIITGETYDKYYMEHIQELVKKALKVDGWQSYEELHYLAEQGANSNFTIEVGTYMGRSATVLAGSKRLICVDTWVKPEVFAEFEKLLKENKHVQHLKGLSKDLADNFPDECADLIFIDGSHEYEDVKLDIEKYLPKLKQNGRMILHDYIYWDGVKKAVDEFKEKNKYEIGGQQIDNTSFYELVKL